MKRLSYTIRSTPVQINIVETVDDLSRFYLFVRDNRQLLGWDTETTGLDWWSDDFRVRLVQFGTADESWVLPVELDSHFTDAAVWALGFASQLVAHNGTFDMHAMEAACGLPMEAVAPKSLDTKLLAHLVDPRALKEGGSGLRLEELTAYYLCTRTAAEVKGSASQIARRLKVSRAEMWKAVDLTDDEYLLYAGCDPVLAYRLCARLLPQVPPRSRRAGLISWEHRLAHITAKIERTGYLLDVDYALEQIAALASEQRGWQAIAAEHGVENVASTRQVAQALIERGIKIPGRTKTGLPKVDDALLASYPDDPLCQAVIRAKRAGKWRTTWFENAVLNRDSNDRVHASINSCQARTARMTITGAVAAQTFPASSSFVRHEFLADEGDVSVSIDYGNMELRVLAAYSQDPVMLDAFRDGKDLHQITADAAGVPRKVGKMANFLTVFGGGPKALAQQAGISLELARATLAAFNETYRGVGRLADRLTREAKRSGYIYTATGRRLPVDKHRAYSALNYFIQSSSRDITARALIELDKAGFTPHVRLPIHDELVFSFPRERAGELAEQAARIMEITIRGVLIPAEPEIGDRSWGSILDLADSKH
ncbi:DNA polymerase [Embleya hyalina]|uniref:DNA polymerase I n=1 Tax=Embleya hyalina TaxID=516124 RepID=A0A401YZ16_9ACTN|nr:DNA polymerase [Embleya hyalina]GCD99837.1 DNA polymerase I [Embleya hyalina]